MSQLDLSRWQFALTVVFHMTFPAITVGLSLFLCVMYGMYWRSGNPVYLQMFRFWRRIFAVGFALGVVAGAVITYEFGLNWGVYAARTGPIIGPIIGMEVVTAFFVEAGFIGVLLYGDGRVRKGVMFLATVMVSIGTFLSSTWIIAANSWMQTPAGYRIVDGQFQPTDWMKVIFNPSFIWRWPHMVLAVLVSASFFIAGLSAWYLIKGRAVAFARRSLSIGLGVAALLMPVQVYLGDHVASEYVAPYQITKLVALEADFVNGDTGWNVLAAPNNGNGSNDWALNIPCLGSYISHDLTCRSALPGLTTFPRDTWPNVAATFWGFRAMIFGAFLMFGLAFSATVLRLRRRLWTARRFHWLLLWLTPVGILSVIGGWVTAEAGRQPWVVFGQLATEDGVSHLAPGAVVFSLIVFVLLYLFMLVAYIAYIAHTMRIGPERDAPGRQPPPLLPDAILTGRLEAASVVREQTTNGSGKAVPR
jgi:cytochrome bd ubiquinol oxidase subunit I